MNRNDNIANGAFEIEVDFGAVCSTVADDESDKSEQASQCPVGEEGRAASYLFRWLNVI